MDYFFGLYLLDKRLVEQEQLDSAVLLAEKENRKIGELAVDAGHVSPEDIEKIRNEQRRKHKLFGETAVELGLLSDTQVEGLLAKQASSNISIGEALLKLSFVTKDQLQTCLNEYQSERQEVRDSLRRHVCSDKLIVYIIDYFPELVLQVADVHTRVEKVTSWTSSYRYDLQASIRLEGKTSLSIAMDVSTPLARDVAMGMFAMEADEIDDEMAIDATKEILNLLAGGLNAQCDNLGRDYSVGIPQADSLPSIGFSCEIVTSNGGGLLIFSRS